MPHSPTYGIGCFFLMVQPSSDRFESVIVRAPSVETDRRSDDQRQRHQPRVRRIIIQSR